MIMGGVTTIGGGGFARLQVSLTIGSVFQSLVFAKSVR